MIEHLQRILVARGLDRWSWPLAESSCPAVKVITVFSDEKLIPVGVSKFGGTPHVTMDFDWPTAEGRPLSFVGQIRFADFQPFQWMNWKVPVPEEGLISLFIDAAREDCPTTFRLIYFAHPKELVRWEDPYALDSPAQRLESRGLSRPDRQVPSFPPRSLAFRQFLSLPPLAAPAIAKLGQTPEESHAFESFAQEHNRADGRHQMLGHPWGSEPIPEGKTLLLQVDSDPLVGFTWPGDGVLRLVMPTEDLGESCFERVTCV
jgi:uncharacterized protein YwqG